MPLQGRCDVNVAVIGQGYVGLPLALAAVRAGYNVHGIEISERKLNSLLAARSYVDDVSDEELEQALATGRYAVRKSVIDAPKFDVVVITVPTPLAEGKPDLRPILSSLKGLDAVLREGSAVMLESTTYPGTTEDVVAPVLAELTGLRVGSELHLGFSPERINPGNGTFDTVTTPKLVSGVSAESLKRVREFYQSLGIPTVDVSGTREAEVAKLLENTFRLVNIALVNEIAEYGHKRGVDVREAIRAASTKPFGFMAFDPGPGVGGHCIPIDPLYLTWEASRSVDMELELVSSAHRVNARRPDYITRAVVEHLDSRNASRDALVIVIGLAYKPGIVDVRNSPAFEIIQGLRARGYEVKVYDPLVRAGGGEGADLCCELTASDLAGAAVAVLVTDHPENQYEEFLRARVPIIDTRNRLGDLAVATV